ncbi:MAG: NlpC/P60 family protein [Pyrinomonadaceae bacterium]
MARSEVLTELRRDLGWLRHQYEEKYGCAVWDVRCHRGPTGSEFFISGYVLLPSQRRALERVVEKRLGGEVRYHLDIETMTHPDPACGDSWGRPKSDLLNVYSRPPGHEAASAHGAGALSTQVTTADRPFRLLFECRGWLLVWLEDCTLGWVQKNLVEVGGSCVNARASTAGANGKAVRTGYDPSEIVERAREAVGVPYLLGGVTGLGIDCSGLAQKVYKDVAAVVLPRHSRDQVAAGRGVPFDRRRAGDLLFLRRNGSRGLHIGLLRSREEVIHASQTRGAVVLEPLSALPASADVVGVRRIVGAFDPEHG